MKTVTDIIRKIDNLGNVQIPEKIRRELKLKEGTLMDIFIIDDMVCFKKTKDCTEVDGMFESIKNANENTMYKIITETSKKMDFYHFELLLTSVLKKCNPVQKSLFLTAWAKWQKNENLSNKIPFFKKH